MTHSITRYHDICMGHRVVGHEGKCRHLHGHNYRIHFVVEAECEIGSGNRTHGLHGLDKLGRVIDFSVVKDQLCIWLEDNWDHKFIYYMDDPLIKALHKADDFVTSAVSDIDNHPITNELDTILWGSFVSVPFNPTAENIAEYLVQDVGPQQLEGTGTRLVEVTVEETRKCSATYRRKK